MSFLWVEMLWLLAVVPALVLGYLEVLRRRKKRFARYSGLLQAKGPASPTAGWQRHAPQTLVFGAVLFMILAVARPVAPITLLARQQTVILAMDVSASMKAEDVWPDRLTASQSAAMAFVSALPPDVRVGIVAYGGTAHVVQPPTRNRSAVFDAIEAFRLQPGTAIGSGLVLSLATLFPQAGIDIERVASWHRAPRDLPIDSDDDGERHDEPPMAPGSYKSAVIVLLSDGQNTTGVNSLDAANLAARKGVKVYTVGFGTRDGDVIQFAGWTVRVRLDEQMLKQIAAITGGEYFHAATGPELEGAYETMTSRIAMETLETEITSLFAAFGAVLILLGSGLSIGRQGRVF